MGISLSGDHRSNVLNHPVSAPPTISQVELILKHTNSTSEINAILIVNGSTNEVHPNCQVTAAINPSEAALTPSSSPLTQGDLHMHGMSGLEMATNMNEGRKMPSSAPGTPPGR